MQMTLQRAERSGEQTLNRCRQLGNSNEAGTKKRRETRISQANHMQVHTISLPHTIGHALKHTHTHTHTYTVGGLVTGDRRTTRVQLELRNVLQSEGNQPSCRLCVIPSWGSGSFTIISSLFISFRLSRVINLRVISSRTLPAGCCPDNTGNQQQQGKIWSHWAVISLSPRRGTITASLKKQRYAIFFLTIISYNQIRAGKRRKCVCVCVCVSVCVCVCVVCRIRVKIKDRVSLVTLKNIKSCWTCDKQTRRFR